MFKKGGGYDLRTNAGRAGKAASDEMMFELFFFAVKVVFGLILLLSIKVLWHAMLTDFYDNLLRIQLNVDPGFLAHTGAVVATVIATVYTPYFFYNYIRGVMADFDGGFFDTIIASFSLGLRIVLPVYLVFFLIPN